MKAALPDSELLVWSNQNWRAVKNLGYGRQKTFLEPKFDKDSGPAGNSLETLLA